MTRPVAGHLSVVAGALAVLSLPMASAADEGDDAERGRQLYYEHACYGCHGYNGETGARDLVGTDSPIVANEAAFIAFLRLRGDIMPVFPSTAMPSYPEAALSDAEARHLFAYIRTFEPDGPEIDEVPALEAIIESASRPANPP